MAASSINTSDLTSMFEQTRMRPFAAYTTPDNGRDDFFFESWDQYMNKPERNLSTLNMFPEIGSTGSHDDDTGFEFDMLQSYTNVPYTPATDSIHGPQIVQPASDLSFPRDTERLPKKDVVNMVLQSAGNKDACLSSNQKPELDGGRECYGRKQAAPIDASQELSLEEIDQLIDRATSPEEKQVLRKQKRRAQNKMNARKFRRRRETEWAELEMKIRALLIQQSELENQVLLLERQMSILSLQNDILMQENTGLRGEICMHSD